MIKFTSDILLFECIPSGNHPEKDQAIEASAILLDKSNFLEKAFYSKPIKTSLLDSVLTRHSELTGRSIEEFRKASRSINVAREFFQLFESDYILACYQPKSYTYLQRFAYKNGLQSKIDNQQVFSIWTIAYFYSRIVGLRKQPAFDTLLEICGITEKPKSTLDYLRTQAKILEKITEKITDL